MNAFKIKCLIASLFDLLGINYFMLYRIGKRYKNNYIRVLNYHHSPLKYKNQFEKQVKWFSNHFELCGIDDLVQFFEGKKVFKSKPGMIITFDDGYLDNYLVAYPFLKRLKIPAVYMVSSGLIGKIATRDGITEEYMDANQLKEIISCGSFIGCHTYSHHRMDKADSDYVLYHEIVESKEELERIINHRVDIFCWCGGEEWTYTRKASEIIRKSGYKLSFMTNSAPIIAGCDSFQIDRSNIEADWPMSLVRFQISGIIDEKLKKKRYRVHDMTKKGV